MKYKYKGKNVSYSKVGNGETKVVLVHGWSGDNSSLKALSDHLGGKYTYYHIDLPGRGDSDNPEKDWGIKEYGDIVNAFIQDVCKGKVIYIGHSFGGALGVYLASNSNSISKLILCAPSYRRRSGWSISQVDEKMKDINERKGLYQIIKPYIKPIRKLAYRFLYPSSEALSLEHLESNFRKIVKTDLSDLLSQIKIPTLIVWGADDIETPLKDAYELCAGINRSDLVIKGSVGHELPVKYPELIADDIKLFLSK